MSLDEVVGYEHFAKYFENYRDQFVVIGGVATIFHLESVGAASRPTKDIDLVVLANPNQSFADKLREYVILGGYQVEADASQKSRNYRFRKPQVKEFPFQIEIFSTVSLDIELREGQVIVPFSTSPGLKSLSAILMDADYFNLVKNCVTQAGGMPLLTVVALIPLKARAFVDLATRKQSGERIDEKDIKKHRNDVLRLGVTLDDANFQLPLAIGKDLIAFFDHEEIKGLPQGTFNSIVSLPNVTLEQVRTLILRYYGLE